MKLQTSKSSLTPPPPASPRQWARSSRVPAGGGPFGPGQASQFLAGPGVGAGGAGARLLQGRFLGSGGVALHWAREPWSVCLVVVCHGAAFAASARACARALVLCRGLCTTWASSERTVPTALFSSRLHTTSYSGDSAMNPCVARPDAASTPPTPAPTEQARAASQPAPTASACRILGYVAASTLSKRVGAERRLVTVMWTDSSPHGRPPSYAGELCVRSGHRCTLGGIAQCPSPVSCYALARTPGRGRLHSRLHRLVRGSRRGISPLVSRRAGTSQGNMSTGPAGVAGSAGRHRMLQRSMAMTPNRERKSRLNRATWRLTLRALDDPALMRH